MGNICGGAPDLMSQGINDDKRNKWSGQIGNIKQDPRITSTYSEVEGISNRKRLVEYETAKLKHDMKANLQSRMQATPE